MIDPPNEIKGKQDNKRGCDWNSDAIQQSKSQMGATHYLPTEMSKPEV